MAPGCKDHRRGVPRKATAPSTGAPSEAGAFARATAELFALIVDDCWLAASVLLWVLADWRLEAMHPIAAIIAGVLFLSGLLLVLGISALRRART